ncbi:MAG TPA: nitrogenase-stabilizing/protective protein NifW [Leptolyngbyaceae cyanobacterium M33_DOE_097]|uniref:Nitrogenase-stabilizing/protective protein NifW n=1 Tax=Oscillatoriales cyanobacterium SpSt-418 TaxID=2282169 RepID=A0A7C3PJ66_9CYAN|nr:nitrogenase-stabilizing/protective protein NifW [Leptolyngbyaceae cyanobacterium M33_DOE_097]
MTRTFAQFKQLVNAEDYLNFFSIPYDPQFVNVNRLHILQKFATFIKTVDSESPDLSETEKLDRYQAALKQAYDTFTISSPLDQKLFKVFNDKPQNVVLLSEIGSD